MWWPVYGKSCFRGRAARSNDLTTRPGEQPTNWVNVLRFLLSKPSRMPVLAHKALKRLRGENDRGSAENDAWLAEHSITAEELAVRFDRKLWEETAPFDTEFRAHAKRILDKIPHDLGGGGDHRFLYWLTRYMKPRVVLETGVAAGWSSRAFLLALKENGGGALYSSDLPYFRLPNPERFVGVLVEPELRRDWTLLLEGDEVNLPRLLATVPEVDVLHYDSDKMRSGRKFAVGMVREKLSPNGIIVMDDIQNDDWFKTYVTSSGLPFSIIEGRYGIIGSLDRPKS
jgi:predicted O-methyltransferase YrrM